MALIGCLFATAVQISRYMSSTVWIFALTTLIPVSRYRPVALSPFSSILYNTVVLGLRQVARSCSIGLDSAHESPTTSRGCQDYVAARIGRGSRPAPASVPVAQPSP